jgi:S-DNA-T family DNA segregation ATPase FtsK/SpoIIIE
MTTTVLPTRRTPTQQPQAPYSDWRHGPVAAAFNASIGTLFLTMLGKFVGVPPWTGLAAGAVMAVCMVLAGASRRPVPLSRVALTYRAVAFIAAGGWMWWQLAVFPTPQMNATQITVMLITWPVTAAVTLAAVVFRQLPLPLRLAGAATTWMFSVVLTMVMWQPVSQWLGAVLATTDRLPWGPDNMTANLVWIGYAAMSLVFIATPMAVLGAVFGNQQRNVDDEQKIAERLDLPRTPTAEARKMRKLYCDLAGEWTDRPTPDGGKLRVPNLKITDVEFWENGAGETYIFDLTGNTKGTTRDQLRSYSDDVATKMNLPEGCGVEVLGKPGMSRGMAAVEVCRVNRLREKLMYPPVQQRSIMNELPLGETRRGEQIGPYFRESSAFICGQKGSGKTVTIWDIIAGAIQCTDCLVWVIDLNGGAAAAPFLSAWYEGRVDRPCIDWVATTIEEVREMAIVGKAIALDRKVHYRSLKRLFNVNLMPIGNGMADQPPPEILIVMDEGAEVMGSNSKKQGTDVAREAESTLRSIMDLARDAAVNIVFSGLRATADVVDPAFKAGTSIRIGMRVSDGPELAYLFDTYDLDPKDIPEQGSGFICTGYDQSQIQVFKSYFLDPARMEEIGEEVTPWRPYLDARGLQIAGPRYANRWRRTARHIWEDAGDDLVNYGAGPVTDADRSAAASSGQPAAAPAGTAIAVLDRPDQIGSAADDESLSDWDQMMKVSDAMRDRDREAYLRRAEGRDQEPAEPADGGGDPPTGGSEPPAEPPAADDDGLDDDEREQAAFEQRFKDVIDNFAVLDQDPATWATPMRPEAEIRQAPVGSREILERLVLVHGPLGWNAMHEKLVAGGDWGPAVPISKQAMGDLLKRPGSKDPVDWLVPRKVRDPYDHKGRMQ